MKSLLLFLLCAATCQAQSVSLFTGIGSGNFNGKWKTAAPVFTAGLFVDNPIGERAGTIIGISYRQRAQSKPGIRIHAVQMDLLGNFKFGKFSAGAGFFFALTAGTRSDLETPDSYTSGVGASGFFSWNALERLGAIPALGLINALVEDQTTVEHRVTVGRMLAVGLFALAWRKQKKTESAYLTLEWSDGRFQYEAVFAFTGAGAMQAANTARNAVLRVVGV